MKFVQKVFLVFTIMCVMFACSKTDNTPSGGTGGLPTVDNQNNQPVGASARELLSSSKQKLVIEIQYMPGFQLQPASVSNLVNFLSARLNKPGGITVSEKLVTAATKDPLGIAEIAQMEKENRTAFNTTDQVAIYFLVTNGGFSTANVLGVSYRNTSMALFGKTISDNSGGLGQTSRAKLESTVLTHEAGHLLGLLDIGTPMVTNHKDGSHPEHCNNSNCLMYYASETTDVLGFLITGNIPGLDQNCLNDLKANGGK